MKNTKGGLAAIMTRYIIKRILSAIGVMIVASLIACFLIRLTPGDPAELLAGDSATPEQVEQIRHNLGYDKPLVVQYLIFLRNALKGDLGTSTTFNMSCVKLLGSRLIATMQLAVAALVIILAVSIPLGLVAALHKGSLGDFASIAFALLGQSMSPAWVGLMLILFFGVKLQLLPTQGYDGFSNLILPAFTLGFSLSAGVTRQLRSGLYAVLQEDYITATYARGIPRREINWKYALKNAILPVITLVGQEFCVMVSGSVVVENVFGWPGIGNLLLRAINNRDYPLVQATLLLMCLVFVVFNLIVDLLYAAVDPRVRLEQ